MPTLLSPQRRQRDLDHTQFVYMCVYLYILIYFLHICVYLYINNFYICVYTYMYLVYTQSWWIKKHTLQIAKPSSSKLPIPSTYMPCIYSHICKHSYININIPESVFISFIKKTPRDFEAYFLLIQIHLISSLLKENS